jgi:ATP-dependent Clp protease ATP-binding subunit ClpA
LITRLKEKGYTLAVSEAVIKHLAVKGFSEEYGARNISRAIQDEVETLISDVLLYNQSQKLLEIEIEKDKVVLKEDKIKTGIIKVTKRLTKATKQKHKIQNENLR